MLLAAPCYCPLPPFFSDCLCFFLVPVAACFCLLSPLCCASTTASRCVFSLTFRFLLLSNVAGPYGCSFLFAAAHCLCLALPFVAALYRHLSLLTATTLCCLLPAASSCCYLIATVWFLFHLKFISVVAAYVYLL